MHTVSHDHSLLSITEIILLIPLILAMSLYMIAVMISNKRFKRAWPIYKTVLWFSGIICAGLGVAGPIAERASNHFEAHMLGHLLLGMLAPIFMVFATPITLILRTLKVSAARGMTTFLKSRPIRIIYNPYFATLMNIGGLWLLYSTDLYLVMQQNNFLHIMIHLHIFLAGYLFTSTILSRELLTHRSGFASRAFMLIIGGAGHAILAKYLYINPLKNVSSLQAEFGAVLMYYGGDVIELVLVFFLWLDWYKSRKVERAHHKGIQNLYLKRYS